MGDPGPEDPAVVQLDSAGTAPRRQGSVGFGADCRGHALDVSAPTDLSSVEILFHNVEQYSVLSLSPREVRRPPPAASCGGSRRANRMAAGPTTTQKILAELLGT